MKNLKKLLFVCLTKFISCINVTKCRIAKVDGIAFITPKKLVAATITNQVAAIEKPKFARESEC